MYVLLRKAYNMRNVLHAEQLIEMDQECSACQVCTTLHI